MTQVLASQPLLVFFWLEPLDKAVHTDVDSVRPTEAPRGSLPKLHPPGRGKVGALRHVKAGVEARVVAAGEGDHDLALVLHDLVVGDAVLPEDHRADHAHLVSQVGRAILFHLREQAVSESFEPPDVGRGDAVPELGRPGVEIIDTVEIHVLRVPGEGCLPAAEIEIGRVDTIDLDSVVLLNVIEDGSEPLNVPLLAARVSYRALEV